MTASVVVLSLAYAAVAALLLNLNLATRLSPWIKASAIVLVSGLYAGTWYGYKGLLGWAAPTPLPGEFRLLWVTMEEPDKTTKEPGAIYFWVRELDEAGLPSGAPRAHRINWTEEAAEAAQEALEKMEDGELLNGTISRNLIQEDDADHAQGADYAGEPSTIGADTSAPRFEFVRVVPPTLPAKAPPPAN